jgi:hypothetical protein
MKDGCVDVKTPKSLTHLKYCSWFCVPLSIHETPQSRDSLKTDAAPHLHIDVRSWTSAGKKAPPRFFVAIRNLQSRWAGNRAGGGLFGRREHRDTATHTHYSLTIIFCHFPFSTSSIPRLLHCRHLIVAYGTPSPSSITFRTQLILSHRPVLCRGRPVPVSTSHAGHNSPFITLPEEITP